MFALHEAYRSGYLAQKYWIRNIVAGLIVGIVALPLAMAFAIASGVKPEQGIYTAIVAGFAVSVFGGSRVQIAGPTGAFIVILAGIVAQHGVEGLQIATLMAGVILLVFGVARLGIILKFIPVPVIIGFTAGIGVIIWVGQWPDFFGLPPVTGHFHQKFWQLLQAFPQLDLATTALSVLSLVLVIFTSRIPRFARVPGPLVALVVVTLIQAVAQFETVATIGSTFGEIPRGLPEFKVPDITLDRMITLIGPAFAIAMLGAIESLLSAVVADGMAGTRHNSNQELVGQGIANMLTPLFGGIAATGAIARTATNIRNGGNSPIAGIVHCLVLIFILLVLAPLAANIPLASLAAILFVVAWNMSEARRVVHLLRVSPRQDVLVLVVCLVLTVLFDMVLAVGVGLLLASALFIKRMADLSGGGQASVRDDLQEDLPESIVLYRIQGPLFFAAADKALHALSQFDDRAEQLIIDMSAVPSMDMSALVLFEQALRDIQQRGIHTWLTGVRPQIRLKLKRAGIDARREVRSFAATPAHAVRLIQAQQPGVEQLTD